MRIVKRTIKQEDIENIVDYVRKKLTRAAVAGAGVQVFVTEAVEPVDATVDGLKINLGWEDHGTDIEIKIGATGFRDI